MNVFDTIFKWIKTGASDDAAAAGEIFPAAGIYQSTVDEVDDGDVGRVRMTARRGLIAAPDNNSQVLFNNGGTGGAGDGAIRSTTTTPKGLSSAAINGKNRSFFISNDLDVSVTVKITPQDTTIQNVVNQDLLSVSVAAGADLVIGPAAAGSTGVASGYESVPALAQMKLGPGASIKIVTGSSPTSGYLSAIVYFEE